MVAAVKGFEWKRVQAALHEAPELKTLTDARNRNLLHLCCGVNPRSRGLKPSDGVKTAGVLLNAGLDIDREAFSEGSWKATPLWYAIARGENLVLARSLLERGADPEHCLWAAAYRDDVAAIKVLVGAGARIDPVAEDATPFLYAVKSSHFRAAELLLRLGADVNFQDSRGMTALHYMLRKGSAEEHLRMVVQHGAKADLANDEGVTAGQILSRKRSPSFKRIARELVRRGLAVQSSG